VPEKRGVQSEMQDDTKEFVPRGAIAFMVVMILAYGVIWMVFYFLMIGRS
jgi:hypothetical protein